MLTFTSEAYLVSGQALQISVYCNAFKLCVFVSFVDCCVLYTAIFKL